MGVEPTWNCFAGSCRAVWLQRQKSSVLARNRTWSSTFAGSRANPPHSEDIYITVIHQRPAEESNPVLQFRGLPCSSGTLARRFQSISSPSRNRTWSCSFGGSRANPAHSRTIHARADDWIRTSIEPVYKTAAFLSRATSAITSKHEREESNPVRQFWRLAALPGAHSCKGPGPVKARSRTH